MAGNSVFMGIPGGNPSGSNAGVAPGGTAPYIGNNSATLGDSTNPLLAPYPAGSANVSSTFPAYATSGTGDDSIEQLLSGMNPTGLSATPLTPGSPLPASGTYSQQWYNTLTQQLHKMGISSGLAGIIASFIATGAGFNPAAIQSQIAALGPSIASGQANIESEFGAQGLGSSSAAALGLAGFNSQVTLDEGQIISSEYEQSVQDYESLLLGLANKKEDPSLISSLLSGGSAAASLLGSQLDNSSGSSSDGTSSSANNAQLQQQIMMLALAAGAV